MADPSACSLVNWPAVREAIVDSRHDGVSAPDLAIRAARLTRAQLGGNNDTARLPAWDAMGIFVRQAPLSASGMLVSQDVPIRVWVRDDDNLGRQRYTVAHEVAHYLIDPSWFAGAELEDACDIFAAELLVPRRVARARLGASGTVGPDDVLALASQLGLNLQPVMRQFATVSWHPAFVTLYVMPGGRVKSGAGTSIGAPFPDKRITTLGDWYPDPHRGYAPGRTAGAATLEYRFGSTFYGNKSPADKPIRSGAVRGTAEWAATKLSSGASIITLQFTDFSIDYSQPRT